ncbi:aKG-HExxH-type peptide beta-hydroxylase [Sorangium sp. So ce1335]|uniref:aKG-HExxH-type peptide beta-hydroxylase n=1 Tax=Sorangium sp. So ce1335 TaxID=3133335 RepID=UPI003F619C7A
MNCYLIDERDFKVYLRSSIEDFEYDVGDYVLVHRSAPGEKIDRFLESHDRAVMALLEELLVNQKIIPMDAAALKMAADLLHHFKGEPPPSKCPVFRQWISQVANSLMRCSINTATLNLQRLVYSMPLVFSKVMAEHHLPYEGYAFLPPFAGVVGGKARSLAKVGQVTWIKVGDPGTEITRNGEPELLSEVILTRNMTICGGEIDVLPYTQTTMHTDSLRLGVTPDLTEQELTEALVHLQDLIDGLDGVDPGYREAILANFRRFLVCVPGNNVYNSGTDRHTFQISSLCVPYHSPAHVYKCANMLVHECSHQLLNQLFALSDLYSNDDRVVEYHHPWMPGKKRPMSGVFLGFHAFVNVVSYYVQLLEREPRYHARIESELSLRMQEVKDVAAYIHEHADLNEKGRHFIGALEATLAESASRIACWGMP